MGRTGGWRYCNIFCAAGYLACRHRKTRVGMGILHWTWLWAVLNNPLQPLGTKFYKQIYLVVSLQQTCWYYQVLYCVVRFWFSMGGRKMTCELARVLFNECSTLTYRPPLIIFYLWHHVSCVRKIKQLSVQICWYCHYKQHYHKEIWSP